MLKHLLLPLTALVIVCADDYDHRYKEGDRVDLWVNKVRESIPKLQLLCEGGRGVCFTTQYDVQIRIGNRGGEDSIYPHHPF